MARLGGLWSTGHALEGAPSGVNGVGTAPAGGDLHVEAVEAGLKGCASGLGDSSSFLDGVNSRPLDGFEGFDFVVGVTTEGAVV